MKNVLNFFKKFDRRPHSLDEPEPSPKVVSIQVALEDGTTLYANNPVFAAMSIDDDIQMHENRYRLPDGNEKIEKIPQRLGMTLKVEFRLFADKTGNFMWVTRREKPLTFRQWIAKALERRSVVDSYLDADDLEWESEE